MNAVNLLWRTDVHMSDVSPSSRTDDWSETVLSKLAQVGQLAKQLDASAVIDGGDFFHVKSPGRNSHDMVRRVAEVHSKYPCPTYANVGNHDCIYGDYSYLDQQPLGVLFATGVFQRNYDSFEVYYGPDKMLYVKSEGKWEGVDPFTLGVHPIVRVVGIPYHGTKYDMARFAQIKRGPEDFLVCHAHVLASPTGGSMFEGEDIIRYADLLAFDPDCFLFGHWHKDQGVRQMGGKTIINIGSLTRGSLSQDDLARKPSVAHLSFTDAGLTVDVIPLRVADAASVFDIEARDKAILRTNTISAFVDSVKNRIVSNQGEDITKIVHSMDVSDRVKERVLLYLEQAKG